MPIIEQNFEKLEQALPAEVLQLIKNSDKISEIYSANNGDFYSKQILKADEIIFQSNATITFTNPNFPFLVVYANKWKFIDNSYRIKFELDRTVIPAKGSDGINGSDGANGVGETNRRGHNGLDGANGSNGEDGKTIKNPDIYLIAEEFICVDENQDVSKTKFALYFDGIVGGEGGAGGNGGNGGRGANGKKGANGGNILTGLECKEGPGDGGTGGNSGAGGKGGNGGDSSNGSNIYFIGKEDAAKILSYSQTYNYGGAPSRGGRAGRAGRPGRGGVGGSPNFPCGAGNYGADGSVPYPEDLGDGIDGKEGERGNVYKIEVAKF